MYFPLVAIVVVVWAWLAGSALYGWRKHVLGLFPMLLSLGGVSFLALVALFVFGPYWVAVYDTILQPG